VVDELVLSHQDQLPIYRSVHQGAQAGVVRIIFYGYLGLKRTKRRVLYNNWPKQTVIRDTAA